MIAEAIVCHLAGDFLLQNEWMQGKGKSSFKCTVHVLCYSLPFALMCIFGGWSWLWLLAVLVQHWLQDRFSLHLKWMRLVQQTTPDKWPIGPLIVDQVWHILFISIMCLVFK